MRNKQAKLNTFLFLAIIFLASSLLFLSIFIYWQPKPISKISQSPQPVPTKPMINQTGTVILAQSQMLEPKQILATQGRYVLTTRPVKITKINLAKKTIKVQVNQKQLSFLFTPTSQLTIVDKTISSKKTFTGLIGLKYLTPNSKVKILAWKKNNYLINVVLNK